MKSYLEQSPPFAPEQAFVVQFGRETAVDTGRMAGCVEHVVSRESRPVPVSRGARGLPDRGTAHGRGDHASPLLSP